jgi:hypothetical protein
VLSSTFYLLRAGFVLGLKMEATCSSKTSVDFDQTTQSYFPEDWTVHNHRCENLTCRQFNSSWGWSDSSARFMSWGLRVFN